MANMEKRAKVLKMQVSIRSVSVRISCGACCIFRGVILGFYPGTTEWSWGWGAQNCDCDMTQIERLLCVP